MSSRVTAGMTSEIIHRIGRCFDLTNPSISGPHNIPSHNHALKYSAENKLNNAPGEMIIAIIAVIIAASNNRRWFILPEGSNRAARESGKAPIAQPSVALNAKKSRWGAPAK